MIINVVLVIVGVAMVSYGAKWLVEGASSLARRLGISDLVIGLTIVAFGTSAPELMVTLTATFQGVPEVALGNVVGSNIFNIGVILGISGLILPLRLQKNTVRKELPLTLLSALVVWIRSPSSPSSPPQAGSATIVEESTQGRMVRRFCMVVTSVKTGLRRRTHRYRGPNCAHGRRAGVRPFRAIVQGDDPRDNAPDGPSARVTSARQRPQARAHAVPR